MVRPARRRPARRAALHRERDQPQRLFGAPNPVALREGRDRRGRGRTGKADAGQRASGAASSPATLHAVVAPGGLVHGPGPLLRRAARRPLRATSTRCWRCAPPRPTPSTPACIRQASTPRSGGSSARPSPGCSGRSSSITTTSSAGSSAIRPSPRRRRSAGTGATARWKALHNADVILMPDTWEYPWYASWDLAFHCVAMACIDPAFAKEQLLQDGPRMVPARQRPVPRLRVELRRRESAASWAGAAWRVYRIERDSPGGATSPSSGRCSRARCSASASGSTGRTPPAATSSAAASSAWTTSAWFDRDQPLPDGGRAGAERRHQLDGALRHHDAHDIAASWPGTSRSTRTWPSSTSSTSSTSPTP